MKKFSPKKILVPVLTFALSLAIIFACACNASCGIYASTLDWAWAVIDAYYLWDVSEEDVRAAGLENLSGNVLDIYSTYYTADEYEQVNSSNEGNRSGIGVSYQYISPDLDLSMGSGVYITSVLGNSPAYKSGLRPGTFVTGAISSDGERVEIQSNTDFSSFMNARQTGEEFTLVTDRGEFVMAKEEYVMSYCSMATSQGEWSVSYDASGDMSLDYADSDRYSYLPEGTAYISLSQFYGNASYEMAELLRQFNSMGGTSLILDLRNNGGGYVSIVQTLAHLFTADLDSQYDAAMYAQFKDGSTSEYAVDKFTSDSSCYLPAGTPVTVLANNGTASASEALIGVLVSNGVIDYSDIYVSDFPQEYLEATGMEDKNCRTYGKGIMQSTFTYFITGEALKLTVARIMWPDGTTCIHDVGVGVNDGCNAVEAAWSVTYADEELQAVCASLAA